jgi:hypothetical protein
MGCIGRDGDDEEEEEEEEEEVSPSAHIMI